MAPTPKHGARAAQHAYSANKLDHRCGWVKEMFAICTRYLDARSVTDETCDIERLTLIHRIGFKTITLRMREAAALRAMRDSDVPPDLGKDFFTCAESLRRDEMALVTLDDRLAKQKRAGTGEWTHEDQPDEEDDEQPATH